MSILVVIALFELTWWKGSKHLRGFVLGCVAMALAFLFLFYQQLRCVQPGPMRRYFLLWTTPWVAAHFGTARLTAIGVMARYLWLLVWPAQSFPARLFLRRDSACQPASLHDWIEWIVVAAVISRGALAVFVE